MTREELKKRLIKIKGTPLPPRVRAMDGLRRGTNYVKTESDYETEDFDTFFDFEEDLAGMESARKQVEKLKMDQILSNNFEPTDDEVEEVAEEPYFIMEEAIPDYNPFFIMEEFEEELDSELENSSKKYDDVNGFEFKYCSFIKGDGEQCKRQAPKDGEYCGTHRKFIKKHGQ